MPPRDVMRVLATLMLNRKLQQMSPQQARPSINGNRMAELAKMQLALNARPRTMRNPF